MKWLLTWNQAFNARPHGNPNFPENAGASAHIEFALAGIDSSIPNDSWYNMEYSCPAEDQAAVTLNWNPAQYFNAYTHGGFGGQWSTLPWACGGNYFEGIRLDWRFVGQPSANGTIGRIPVHETGHYLGLYHTSNCFCSTPDSCSITGDLICDVAKTAPGICVDLTGCRMPYRRPGAGAELHVK